MPVRAPVACGGCVGITDAGYAEAIRSAIGQVGTARDAPPCPGSRATGPIGRRVRLGKLGVARVLAVAPARGAFATDQAVVVADCGRRAADDAAAVAQGETR